MNRAPTRRAELPEGATPTRHTAPGSVEPARRIDDDLVDPTAPGREELEQRQREAQRNVVPKLRSETAAGTTLDAARLPAGCPGEARSCLAGPCRRAEHAPQVREPASSALPSVGHAAQSIDGEAENKAFGVHAHSLGERLIGGVK